MIMAEKRVSQTVRQKHPKNRRNKRFLVFDEQARAEYLTGFRKRKNERRKKAKEEMIEQLKEERREIKKRKREQYLTRLQRAGLGVPEVEHLVEPVTFDLPDHTVTVTDVSTVDLTGNSGLLLGRNEADDVSDRAQNIQSKDKEPSLKQMLKLRPKKGKHKRHKNLTHLMDKHNASRAGFKKKRKGQSSKNRKHKQIKRR